MRSGAVTFAFCCSFSGPRCPQAVSLASQMPLEGKPLAFLDGDAGNSHLQFWPWIWALRSQAIPGRKTPGTQGHPVAISLANTGSVGLCTPGPSGGVHGAFPAPLSSPTHSAYF